MRILFVAAFDTRAIRKYGIFQRWITLSNNPPSAVILYKELKLLWKSFGHAENNKVAKPRPPHTIINKVFRLHCCRAAARARGQRKIPRQYTSGNSPKSNTAHYKTVDTEKSSKLTTAYCCSLAAPSQKWKPPSAVLKIQHISLFLSLAENPESWITDS